MLLVASVCLYKYEKYMSFKYTMIQVKACCLFGICLLIGTTEYLICIPRVNLGLSEQARKEFNMGYFLCTYSSMYVQRWKHKILHKNQ